MEQAPPPDFDGLWDYGRPVETEIAFRRNLAEFGPTAGEAYCVELETQIARTLGLQRKFEEAHGTLDAVLPKLATTPGRCRVRYLLERGRIFNSSGHKAEALPLFVEAWELGRDIGEDGLAVDAAHMVAIVEESDAALRWNLTGLELANSSPMPSAQKWRKSLHNNIGWTFFDMGQLEPALHHFTKCREFAEQNADAESERIARWSIAKTHRLLGQVETALEMQRAILAELDEQGQSDGFAFEEQAECLLALGRQEEASPYFAKAFEVLSEDPWLSESEPDRLQRLQALSKSA